MGKVSISVLHTAEKNHDATQFNLKRQRAVGMSEKAVLLQPFWIWEAILNRQLFL
jgi:hypothetical protein